MNPGVYGIQSSFEELTVTQLTNKSLRLWDTVILEELTFTQLTNKSLRLWNTVILEELSHSTGQ
jgi:hypothetical protein